MDKARVLLLVLLVALLAMSAFGGTVTFERFSEPSSTEAREDAEMVARLEEQRKPSWRAGSHPAPFEASSSSCKGLNPATL